LLAKGFTGREVRYLLLTAHYRETFNFTLEGLAGAKTALARIDECVGKLREIAGDNVKFIEQKILDEEKSRLIPNFASRLDDDLNISGMWGEIFDWIRETNKRLIESKVTPEVAEAALIAWQMVDGVLGIGMQNQIVEIPSEIKDLAEARVAAKKIKDFKQADAIRNELKAKGWLIEDAPKGIKLKKL